MTREIRVLLVGGPDAVSSADATWTDADSSLTVDDEPSPFTALERLEDGEFDCVVSAGDMEGMSGLEFAARVGRTHPTLPLITVVDSEEDGPVATETLGGSVKRVQRLDGSATAELADHVTTAVHRSDRAVETGTVEERSQRLAQRTHDAIVSVDGEDTIDYASPSVERIFGYGPEELRGEPFTKLIADRLEEQYRSAVSRYLRTGAVELDWQSLQVPGKHRDGRDVPLMLSIVESETEDGQLTVIIRDLSKQAHLETELEAQLDRMGDGFFALDTDFTVTYANEQARDLLRRGGDDDVVGENIWDVFPEAVDTVFETEYRRALDEQEETDFEAYFEPLDAWFSVRAYPSSTGLSVYYQDVTEQKERERALERRQNRLEVVAELSDLIGSLNEALVDVSGRSDIEQLVCDKLVESDHIVAAWQGRPPTRGPGINPTAWAGIDRGTIRQLHPDEDGPSEPLSRAALDTKEVQVGTRGATEDSTAWDDPAIPEEYAATAVIPLAHKSSTYGVLHVYTEEKDLFVDEVVDTLAQLRDVVGNAISAAERKMALMADRSVELELQVRDSDEYFLSAAGETGTRLELDGTVAQSDGTYLEYYTATGDDVEAFASRMDDSPRIENVSTIDQSGDEHLLSLTFVEPKVSELLAQYGGTFQKLVVEDGVGTVVAEFPRGADLRGVIGAFEAEFASVDLRAKRENKHPSESTSDFKKAFEEKLTDRQREAIETAHHAGYFDWPRESDAEEIAEALGISSPTLHEHLRAAQNKLLSGLLGNEGDSK